MSIHGHEILHYLLDHEPTPEALREHVDKAYGSDATFHTCSAEGMSLEELLAFLDERGKIALVKGRFVADPEKICQHEH